VFSQVTDNGRLCNEAGQLSVDAWSCVCHQQARSLKGALSSEFFYFAIIIISILFERGLYV